MTLVSSTMIGSEMLSNFYAYQALNYFFKDEEKVKIGVLPLSLFTTT